MQPQISILTTSVTQSQGPLPPVQSPPLLDLPSELADKTVSFADILEADLIPPEPTEPDIAAVEPESPEKTAQEQSEVAEEDQNTGPSAKMPQDEADQATFQASAPLPPGTRTETQVRERNIQVPEIPEQKAAGLYQTPALKQDLDTVPNLKNAPVQLGTRSPETTATTPVDAKNMPMVPSQPTTLPRQTPISEVNASTPPKSHEINRPTVASPLPSLAPNSDPLPPVPATRPSIVGTTLPFAASQKQTEQPLPSAQTPTRPQEITSRAQFYDTAVQPTAGQRTQHETAFPQQSMRNARPNLPIADQHLTSRKQTPHSMRHAEEPWQIAPESKPKMANAAQPFIMQTTPSAPLVSWQTPQGLSTDIPLEKSVSIDPITGEPRLSPLAAGSSIPASAPRPELPAQIARQLAEGIQQNPNRAVEITLKPQELGTVRLSLQPAETGIVVSLIAERPETLDLMRRNIDQLGAEFKDLGYTNIAFSFADAKTDSEPDGQSNAQSPLPTSEAGENETTQTATRVHLSNNTTSGVDLRL